MFKNTKIVSFFVARREQEDFIKDKRVFKKISTIQKFPNIKTLHGFKKLNNPLKLILNKCGFCNQTFAFDTARKVHEQFCSKKK